MKSPLGSPSQLLSPPFPPEVIIILNLTGVGESVKQSLAAKSSKGKGRAGPKEDSLAKGSKGSTAYGTPSIPALWI